MLIRIGIHGERKKPLAEQVPTTRISNRQFTTAGFTNRKLENPLFRFPRFPGPDLIIRRCPTTTRIFFVASHDSAPQQHREAWEEVSSGAIVMHHGTLQGPHRDESDEWE